MECPLRVISAHGEGAVECPLYLRKRTLVQHSAMFCAKNGHSTRSRPRRKLEGFGLRLNDFEAAVRPRPRAPRQSLRSRSATLILNLRRLGPVQGSCPRAGTARTTTICLKAEIAKMVHVMDNVACMVDCNSSDRIVLVY